MPLDRRLNALDFLDHMENDQKYWMLCINRASSQIVILEI